MMLSSVVSEAMAEDTQALATAVSNREYADDRPSFSKRVRRMCVDLLESTEETHLHAAKARADEFVPHLEAAFRGDPSRLVGSWQVRFFQVCLKFGYDVMSYELASTKWSAFEKGLSSVELLQFQYYTALVFIRSREYSKARVALIQALAVPGTSISVIQVSCLRKLCLVDLILFGEVKGLPGWLSKGNPLLSQLFDGARIGAQSPSVSTDFSPEKSAMRSNRLQSGSAHGGEAFQIANPDVVCPSSLSDIIKTFMTRNSSVTDVMDAVKCQEGHLKKGKDWGLALRLGLAKSRHSLNRMAEMYTKMHENDIRKRTGCRTHVDWSELVREFNVWSSFSGVGIQSCGDGFWHFHRCDLEESFRTLTADIKTLKQQA